jgi:hypothetical protein
MKMVRSLLLSLPLMGVALLSARNADACGACVVPVGEDTTVTGHRMIFSTSMTQTTLYDQIEYAGEPSEFAWVLPIHGQVDVALSADAMFAFLGSFSSVQVLPPPLNCPDPPSGCYDEFGEGDGAGPSGTGGAGGSNGGGVTVIVQETIGPYETVQLEASDPTALKTWLSSHNYNVPNDLQPVIDAYQSEGFGFLAMKLVPGQGVKAMRPVRVTSQGSGLTLPLRMVAGGTGAITPITLFVVGEGRYEAQNFPNLKFDPAAIVFHWDDYSSNYEPLIKGLFSSSNGFGWLTQHAEPLSKENLIGQVQQVIDFNPDQSGWGDPANGVSEKDDATADLNQLFAGMNANNTWLTRMHAQLSRPALGNDLKMGAEASQTQVSRYIQAQFADGNIPECPDYSWCVDNGGDFTGLGQNGGSGSSNGKGSCAIQRAGGNDGDGTAALLAGIGLAAAAVVMRRRRNK